MKDRCYGCMLGALIGDATGSYNEYSEVQTTDQVHHIMSMPGGGYWSEEGWVAGQITNDGEMAICMLRGLGEVQPGNFNIDLVASWYHKWTVSEPILPE